MTTLKDIYALTKSEVDVEDTKRVTLALDEEIPARVTVRMLKYYFGQRKDLQAIRLTTEGQERGYLLRTDLRKLTSSRLRGVGSGDGSTLPGYPPPNVKFIELCCPTTGCTEVWLVTRYNKSNPPVCDIHGTPMRPCK